VRTKLMRPMRLWRLYQARKRVPSWGVAVLIAGKEASRVVEMSLA
jgi:hypothetical protein